MQKTHTLLILVILAFVYRKYKKLFFGNMQNSKLIKIVCKIVILVFAIFCCTWRSFFSLPSDFFQELLRRRWEVGSLEVFGGETGGKPHPRPDGRAMAIFLGSQDSCNGSCHGEGEVVTSEKP